MYSAMVIIASMLSGVAIAIVAWYHRRPHVSILEGALLCAAIGLAVGAAVLAAVRESAERQRRVVHIGDRSIVLYAPPGFVMIGPEWPELWKSLEASYPGHRRLIVGLVPEYTYTRLREHKVAELQRLLTIDVPRRLEHARLALQDFAQEKERLGQFLAHLMGATSKAQLPELIPKLEEILGRSLSSAERDGLNDFSPLPVHRDTENIHAFSHFQTEKRAGERDLTWAVTHSMVLVKDLVLDLRVMGSQQDLEWTRLISDQLTDATLAANVASNQRGAGRVDPSYAYILTWLRDENSEKQIAALRDLDRAIGKGSAEVEAFLSEFPHPLRASNADVRWLAVLLLSTRARGKDVGTLVPHLEALFDDPNLPSWFARTGAVLTVGVLARRVVVNYYVQYRKSDQLRALIANGGLPAVDALHALRSAADADVIVPLLPDLAAAQRSPDERTREAAAAGLAHYHWLNRQWDQIRVLLLNDDRSGRLGTISTLSSLAARGNDIQPILQELAGAQRSPDETLRQRATAALTHHYLLKRRWDWFREHLLSNDASVRLAIIEVIDHRVVDEPAASTRDIIEPLVPALLSLLEQRDDSFKSTREAAAGLLLYLVPNLDGSHIPEPFVLNGVNIMKIPEVEAQLKNLQQEMRDNK
jgi:hypothetical protein